MNNLIKFLLGGVALLVVLLVVVIAAVAMLVDPDDYRDEIAQGVTEATGRTLTIDGPLDLKLLPCCSLALGPASLGNPPGFEDPTFASVKTASIGIRIWPLLTQRELRVGDLVLDGLDATLITRKDGTTNWDFESAPAEAAKPADGEAGPQLSRFSVAGIRVRDARLRWQDATTGDDYLLEDLRLETSAIELPEPFDLEAGLRFEDRRAGTKARLDVSGRIAPTVELDGAGIEKLEAQLELAGKDLPARRIALRLASGSGQVEADQELRVTLDALDADVSADGLDGAESAAAKLALGGVSLKAGSATTLAAATLEGEVNAKGVAASGGPVSATVAGKGLGLTMAARTRLSLDTARLELTASGSELPEGGVEAQADLAGVAFNVDAGQGSVKQLSAALRAAGASAALTGAGRFGGQQQDLSGTLELEPLSPRELLAALKQPPVETTDPAVLGRLAGSGDWYVKGGGQLGLSRLDVTLDDSRLTGSAGLEGEKQPRIRFDLRVDKIDLDRYLAPATEADGEVDAGASREKTRATKLPLESLRELRLAGRARIGELVFAKAKLGDVDATVNADGGQLVIEPMRASVYGGTYAGRIAVDARGKQAQVSLDQRLAAVQAGDLLRDVADVRELTGALSGEIRAEGAGRTDRQLLKNLKGNLSFSLADGVYNGMDVWYEIRKARALIRRKPAPPAPARAQTPINALELGGRLAKGALRSDRLRAEIPFLAVTGGGTADLLKGQLDYALKAKVIDDPVFPDGETLSDLKGLTIPLTIKGPLAEPSVGVDLAGLTTSIATEAVRDKLLERLGGKQEAEPAQAQPSEGGEPAAEPQKEEKPRDILKRGLRELLEKPE